MDNLQSITNANQTDDQASQIDETVVSQFKMIILVVLVILIFFLGFFIYNLIKCYLPKWRKKELVKEESGDQNAGTRKIEFEEL